MAIMCSSLPTAASPPRSMRLIRNSARQAWRWQSRSALEITCGSERVPPFWPALPSGTTPSSGQAAWLRKTSRQGWSPSAFPAGSCGKSRMQTGTAIPFISRSKLLQLFFLIKDNGQLPGNRVNQECKNRHKKGNACLRHEGSGSGEIFSAGYLDAAECGAPAA